METVPDNLVGHLPISSGFIVYRFSSLAAVRDSGIPASVSVDGYWHNSFSYGVCGYAALHPFGAALALCLNFLLSAWIQHRRKGLIFFRILRLLARAHKKNCLNIDYKNEDK